ncbi:MAG: hypothetical protein IJJ45_00845 [Clostridia bacterium]|nr:hypothetical protein [Clostridia bacterium]
MSVIRSFLEEAHADRPVYISRVRDAFQQAGSRPFHIHMHLYDGSVRRFALLLPAEEDAASRAFIEEYLTATLYNALSALGAQAAHIYVDPADRTLSEFAARLNAIFQSDAPLAARAGWGKCLNVNQRVLASLLGPDVRFRFDVRDIACEPPVPLSPRAGGAPVFADAPAIAARGRYMGMDIGGTDIKLAASLDGHLCAFKEYDWNPAACTCARQLLDPLELLTRLMRAAVCMAAEGLQGELPAAAFDRTASDGDIAAAVAAMEARLGDRLRPLDGIGLCFPDVVIKGRIAGGETPKTQGIRGNAALDYESEFGRLSSLGDRLAAFVRPGGAVRIVNDGPMAAFTAAVEQAAAGRDLSNGCFAHSLGTDLGTGWILPDGGIPEIPLEVYNFIIDLGCHGQRAFDPHDVRSTRNFTTGLPGSLQKYAGQFGVFRMAAKQLPQADPALYRSLFDEGLFRWSGDRLIVPTAPDDMRKPCLERFMQAAADPAAPAAELFRGVGEALAVTWRETKYLLSPACDDRSLFGRLVKHPPCFRAICEGARRITPALQLEAADEGLANTPLMRQLAAHPDLTVAQFAQAVGAIHFACVRPA